MRGFGLWYFMILTIMACYGGFSIDALADADSFNLGIPLHGFADGGWAQDSSNDLHRSYARGFYLNNLDLYLAPDLGGRMRMLAEVVLEPGSEGQGIGIDTERLQLGYVFSNYLTAWVGRFHTPLGFFVTAYHHGAQLQTAVDKPRFLDWEDHQGVLPVHTTGLWLTGNALIGDSRLGYMLWAGNGGRMTTGSSGFTGLDMNMYHDDNKDVAVGGRLTWFFGGALDGLQVGASMLQERIDATSNSQDPDSYTGTGATFKPFTNPNTGSEFSSKVRIVGIHLVYEGHGFEFLNEIYNFQNIASGGTSGNFRSWAGYSQLAYWVNGKWAPYGRFERADFNVNDPFFFGQYNGLPYSKAAVGLRYNMSDASCVKIEYSNTHFNASSPTNSGAGYNIIKTDYAVRF